MSRPARLQAARHWLVSFGGKNVTRGYARWFGVDLVAAVKELQLLGVELDPCCLAAIPTPPQRRRGKHIEPVADKVHEGYGDEWDENFAFIAGFTSGGAPFGVTWDEASETENV